MLEHANRLSLLPLVLASILLLAAGTAHAQTGNPTSPLVTRPAANHAAAGQVSVPWAQSAWVKGYNSSTRLLAGRRAGADAKPGSERTLLAGVEIRMSDGWKTYWRHPGDDGGMPPSIDWSGSRNLKSARVLYPVPERLKSIGGTSIGYTKAVIFPVEIEAVDPAQPIELEVGLEYGICREICVPAEAKLRLDIQPLPAAMPPDLMAAVGRVPRVLDPAATNEKTVLKAASAILAGPSPSLTFEIATAPFGSRIDLFVEAPDGLYLPMTIKVGEAGAGVQRFRVDLKGVDDIARLAGKTLRLTVAGNDGGVEAAWVVR